MGSLNVIVYAPAYNFGNMQFRTQVDDASCLDFDLL
jgi:hypothetical protein